MGTSARRVSRHSIILCVVTYYMQDLVRNHQVFLYLISGQILQNDDLAWSAVSIRHKISVRKKGVLLFKMENLKNLAKKVQKSTSKFSKDILEGLFPEHFDNRIVHPSDTFPELRVKP